MLGSPNKLLYLNDPVAPVQIRDSIFRAGIFFEQKQNLQTKLYGRCFLSVCRNDVLNVFHMKLLVGRSYADPRRG